MLFNRGGFVTIREGYVKMQDYVCVCVCVCVPMEEVATLRV